MSDLKAKTHQNRFRLGLSRRPRSPRPSSWISGAYFQGEGKGKEGDGRKGERRGGSPPCVGMGSRMVNPALPVALPRFRNLRTEVWNVRKSRIGRYQASRDKAARWLCVHGALGLLYF